MELVKKSIGKWITAAVILVIGILCIIAGAQAGKDASANAYEGISIVLGVVFIIIAAIALILGVCAVVLTKNETSLATTGIGAGVTLAAGILFCCNRGTAGELIWLFINFVPYVLIVVGSVIALDAIFLLVFSIIKKNVKAALVSVIVECVVAIVSILLGSLSIGDDPVITKNAQLIIFGVIVALYAVLLVLRTFVTVPTVVIIEKHESVKEDDVIQASNETTSDDVNNENNSEEKAE